jgi:hypothetical protein
MVPGRLIQLRFKTLLKKEKSLFFVVIEKDSREPKGFLRVKVKDYVLYLHPCSSSSHFLIIDLEGTLPADFTFPLMISAGVGRIPY